MDLREKHEIRMLASPGRHCRPYTAWGARQLFLDDRIGSLEIGKEADIAIWDRDMYTMPAQELRNLKCTMTLLHGQVVFGSDRP